MSLAIRVFMWMVDMWNWICQWVSVSCGYVSWQPYIIVLSELDVLTESTILVWLCRRYSAEWVLSCLELGLIALVCCLVVLIGIVSFLLMRLCHRSINHLYGGISSSTGQALDNPRGNIQVLGNLHQEAIEAGSRISPQGQLEEAGCCRSLGLGNSRYGQY